MNDTPEDAEVKADPPKPEDRSEAKAIALSTGGAVQAIVPRNLNELAMVASAIIKAGLAPDSYKGGGDDVTKSRIMIGIMKGAEVGLPPITALSTIFLVNNRPSIFGDGAIALVQASGRLEWIKEYFEGTMAVDDEGRIDDKWTAVCEMKRKHQAEVIRKTFSWGDARRAGLIGKGPWKLYPQRMLQMRARAWCIRDGFADCLSGLAIAEEVQDMPAPAKAVDTAILDDEPTLTLEKPSGETVVIDKDGYVSSASNLNQGD